MEAPEVEHIAWFCNFPLGEIIRADRAFIIGSKTNTAQHIHFSNAQMYVPRAARIIGVRAPLSSSGKPPAEVLQDGRRPFADDYSAACAVGNVVEAYQIRRGGVPDRG